MPSAEWLDRIVLGSSEVKVRVSAEVGEEGGANLWDSIPIWLRVDRRDGGKDPIGSVLDSAFDRDAIAEGELRRDLHDGNDVFDVAVFADDGHPIFNEERARFLLGRTVSAGVTALSSADEPIEQRQYAGLVTAVDEGRGVTLQLDDGSNYTLPPDLRPFEEARPGEYRPRSSGKIVLDPDYVCTWSMQMRSANDLMPPGGFSAP